MRFVRLRGEALESRRLLSLSNIELSAAQKQSVLDGLDGLVIWVKGLDEYSLVAQALPVIGESVGQFIDLDGLIQTRVVDPVHTFINGDALPTTSDELVSQLQGLGGTFGNLTVTISAVTGGLDNVFNELAFNLVFHATQPVQANISLGPKGDRLGIHFDTQVTVNTSFNFDFTFGLDLTPGLPPAEVFFIRANDLSASAAFDASSLASGGHMRFGFFGGALANGELHLNAQLSATLNDPNSSGELTLAELEDTTLSNLVNLNASGSASGSVQFSVSSFGGFTPSVTTPSISFGPIDPFIAPPLNFFGLTDLLPFTSLSSFGLIGILDQLRSSLGDLKSTSLLDDRLVLAKDLSLADALHLDRVFANSSQNGLIDQLFNPDGTFAFDTAQSLATKLQTLLGSGVNEHYDPITHELTYHVGLTRDFSDSASLGLNLNLRSIAHVVIPPTSTVDLNASAMLGFTLGVILSPPVATVVASADAPGNGQLTQDAHFSLSVGGGSAVPVSLAAAETSANSNLDDLVADVNAALAAAGLAGYVQAGRDGDRLTLFTAGIGVDALLQLAADEDDPAVTELHFDSTALAADAILKNAFIEGASVHGSASATAADIDATARFGLAGLDINDGAGSAQIAADFQLKNPHTGAALGRVTLLDLFQAIAGQGGLSIGDLATTPTLTGSASLTLPITSTFVGITSGTNASLVVTWPDINSGEPGLQFNNASSLNPFEHITSLDIADALIALGSYLQTLDLSALNVKLPALDVSISKIVGYADKFLELANVFKDNPAAILQLLESSLETAFDLEPDQLTLSLLESNQVIRVDLALGREVSAQRSVNLDLGGLGVNGVGHVLDFRGSSALDIEAGVAFDLAFGIDLHTPESPRPFIYDTTTLDFSAKASGTSIAFATALGPLGVFVNNGNALIDDDGDAGNTGRAHLIAHIQDTGPSPDGKVFLSEIGLGNVAITASGQVHAVLPVYFPLQTTLLGNIDLAIGNLGNIAGTTTLTAPDFAAQFANFAFLDNLNVMLAGLDYLLGQVETAIKERGVGKHLPLIGDHLDRVVAFIEAVRDHLHQSLEQHTDTEENSPEMVRTAVFDALGPSGLGLLEDRPDDADAVVTIDDIVVTLTDTNDDGQQDDQVDYDFRLGRQLTLVDESLGIDLGLPALGLKVDGNIELQVGFEWHVQCGVSRDLGAYFGTPLANELTINLSATVPGLDARGNLLFLQLDVHDDPLTPSAFTAGLAVDLKDPSATQDQKLTFDEIASHSLTEVADIKLNGSANVNLDLVVSYEGDARFPSLRADLDIAWPFASGTFTGEKPTVAFHNVALNVGSWLSDFLDPVLKTMRNFLAKADRLADPIQEIVQFLTTPLPIISSFGIHATALDLAKALGFADVTFLEDVSRIASLAISVPVIGGSVLVPLGSFDLGPTTDLRLLTSLSGVTPNPLGPPVNPADSLPAQAHGFYNDLKDVGLELPIIDNPASVFKLFLGQDVDLIRYDMPDLNIRFSFPDVRIGPLLPPIPIFATFGGSVGAKTDLSFGYDTHGLRTYLKTHDTHDIFAGFYANDRDAEGFDKLEAHVFGEVTAGVELNIGVASAGVQGGVTAELGVNLNDPDGDGRVHLDEFLENLDKGFVGTFDVEGDVSIFLRAYVEFIFGGGDDKVLFNKQVVKFNLTPPAIYHDRFANHDHASGNDSQPAATDMGIGPGQHVDGLSIEDPGDVDWYKFELLKPDSVDVDIRFSDSRGAIDLEVYDAASVKLGSSATTNDREAVSLQNLPAGTYYAKVFGDGSHRNNYLLAVEPGPTSTTRVIYVNPSTALNHDHGYFTVEPGNDDHDGLAFRKPKATLQSVLDTYTLGPNDLVVFDTGTHAAGGIITASDARATYVGTPEGSYVSGVVVQGSDGSLFDRIGFGSASGTGTGLLIAGASANNTIRRGTIQKITVGIQVDSGRPNLIENNTSVSNGKIGTGIYLAAPATATVRGNDIQGRATGIYSRSKLAAVYGNLVHGNAIGIAAAGAVVGPDNPSPVGTPADKPVNDVYANDTGILIPGGASGTIVRFNTVRDNTVVGIEALAHDSRIVANDIYGNTIGVRGSDIIGPADWETNQYNLIHNNATGVWTNPGAEARFNRVYANTVGIHAAGGDVHHNLVYNNTDAGVLASGGGDVELRNNTIYAPAGDGVRLDNVTGSVAIRSNIVQVASGAALYVAANSQFRYTSDYNNLFATASGKVEFQSKDFYDLYDWQVEAEQDLHSIGTTILAPTLDDPQFASAATADFQLQTGSTSIDAGDPASDYSQEPAPNGNRIDLGAYGNTPQAGLSPAAYIDITAPEFYQDLEPGIAHSISWRTYNVSGSLDIDLYREGFDKVADIAVVAAADGSTSWIPQSFGITSSTTNRYRIRITSLANSSTLVDSRETFSVVASGSVFYVDDSSDALDQYTPSALGNNRNTGTTTADPKAAIRSVVLSYQLDPGDTIYVDTGNYVHAVNLNLSSSAISFDPRIKTATSATITGPTDTAKVAQIDRANPFAGATAIDLMSALSMTLANLTIVGAEIGVHARDASTNLALTRLKLSGHAHDGIVVEGGSNGVTFDFVDAFDNGRDGLVVDSSQLVHIFDGDVHDNERIGINLKSVGAALVETTRVHDNQTGIDIINPGGATATIGNSALELLRGNLVYGNDQDGVFASGYVLVTGNTSAENGRYGIRLDDGADATRNVARQNLTGISALGSTSDISENRVFAHSQTGIEASYLSNILRNVVYSSGLYGIHADRFSGWINHNLVYATGFASMLIEGPGSGARVDDNTVFEPCFMNIDPHQRAPIVEVPWDWFTQIEYQPNFPQPGQMIPISLSGTVAIQFGNPFGLSSGGTFDLGRGGGMTAPTPQPVPPGETWQIDMQIIAMNLMAVSSPLGPVLVRLKPNGAHSGRITVENQGGTLVGSSFFDVSVEFVLPNQHLTLSDPVPMHIGNSFGPGLFDPLAVLQTPFAVNTQGSLVDLFNQNSQPSGRWIFVQSNVSFAHGDVPPAQSHGNTCADIGILIRQQEQQVFLRNNEVFVEGDEYLPPEFNSLDIVVEADSTLRWDSKFNILLRDWGNIGRFAGALAVTLPDWQAITGDDRSSISPDPDFIWVDRDGADNILGFAGLGSADGRDDNFHLRSPFGHAISGALAPAEVITGQGFPSLPKFLPLVFELAPAVAIKSPSIDWGEPSYDYSLEPDLAPIENGQIIDVGTYGNTDQASSSEPYYIHMVSPLGFERLVPGRTYQVQWRSHNYFDPLLNPGALVNIDLRHGSAAGPLEAVIAFGASNTGLRTWTVPASVIPADDYVVVITRSDGSAIGASRFTFTIRPDDVPPFIISTTPQAVDRQLATNASISTITLSVSEGLNAASATSAANYELRSSGLNGMFGDGDDVVRALTRSYTAPVPSGGTSTVTLTIVGGPLAAGNYRLRALSGGAGLRDTANLQLDGNHDGVGGDAYERFFTVDFTPPAASIVGIAPDPRNAAISAITIVLSEPVTELGLSDLRLSRNGGVNLLTGAATLSSSDGMVWFLGNLFDLTGANGQYTITLTAASSNIADRAGNLLSLNASDSWITDTLAPTADLLDVFPDPRTGGVDEITIVFSEAVVGLSLADLALARDGGANLLTALQTLTTSDNVTWTLGNLSMLTTAEGAYSLSLAAAGSGVVDMADNALAADAWEGFVIDSTGPNADIVDVSPDPRHTAVGQIAINFSEPVFGFDLSDLALACNGGDNLLTGAQTLSTNDEMHWILGNVAGLTAADGAYSLTLSAGGIHDAAGNLMMAGAADTWTAESIAPTVDIGDVAPDPRHTSVSQITIVFSEAVIGLDLADLHLTRDGSPVTLSPLQTLSTTDQVTWTLGNLAALTAAAGSYELTLNPAGAGISDLAGNVLTLGASDAFIVDTTAPTADILNVSPDPRPSAVDEITITFTKPVFGFDLADLRLSRNGGLNLLNGTQTLMTSDNVTYAVGNLAGLTASGGSYVLSLPAFGASITDQAGNFLSISASDTFVVNPPLVVINIDDDDPGSLRQAILDANSAGRMAHTILFEIPGAASQEIQLAAMLPALVDPATMDVQFGHEVRIGTASAYTLGDFVSITKTGAGALVIGGDQSHAAAAAFSVTAGTATLRSDGGPRLTANASHPGSLISFATTQHLARLNLTDGAAARLVVGGDKVLVTSELSIAADATLDLADNALVVQATPATGAAVLTAVTTRLAVGYGSGPNHWSSVGINSSVAAADAAKLTAVGVLLNRNAAGQPIYTNFRGQAVDADSVLARFTYYGDANLSGHVDGTDYASIDNGFNFGLSGWVNGDFNYNGVVDGTDYALIDNAFNLQGGPLAALSARLDLFLGLNLVGPDSASHMAPALPPVSAPTTQPQPLDTRAVVAALAPSNAELQQSVNHDATRRINDPIELSTGELDDDLLELLAAGNIANQ